MSQISITRDLESTPSSETADNSSSESLAAPSKNTRRLSGTPVGYTTLLASTGTEGDLKNSGPSPRSNSANQKKFSMMRKKDDSKKKNSNDEPILETMNVFVKAFCGSLSDLIKVADDFSVKLKQKDLVLETLRVMTEQVRGFLESFPVDTKHTHGKVLDDRKKSLDAPILTAKAEEYTIRAALRNEREAKVIIESLSTRIKNHCKAAQTFTKQLIGTIMSVTKESQLTNVCTGPNFVLQLIAIIVSMYEVFGQLTACILTLHDYYLRHDEKMKQEQPPTEPEKKEPEKPKEDKEKEDKEKEKSKKEKEKEKDKKEKERKERDRKSKKSENSSEHSKLAEAEKLGHHASSPSLGQLAGQNPFNTSLPAIKTTGSSSSFDAESEALSGVTSSISESDANSVTPATGSEPSVAEDDDEVEIPDKQIWEENHELPENKVGSLNMLVLKLTSLKDHDLNFLKTFIITYQSFTTPWKLFEKLEQRYHPPSDMTAEQVQTIRVRVGITLKYWVENQFLDFDLDMVQKLEEFVEKTMPGAGQESLATMLKGQIKKQLEIRQSIRSPTVNPDEAYLVLAGTNSLTQIFLNYSEEEFAQQLTMIDCDFFRSIEPKELLNCSWSDKKLQYRASNLIATLTRLNDFSYFIATLLLSQEKLSGRTAVLLKLLGIAQCLKNLNNYQALMGLNVGLNLSPCQRLKHTWDNIKGKTKIINNFRAIEKLMNPEGSFKNYRTTLATARIPAIPYLGVWLGDLTFIEDGNLDNINGHINFPKRELVFNVVSKLSFLQTSKYDFPPVEPLNTFLRQLPRLSEKELYDISLSREPRGATIKQIQ